MTHSNQIQVNTYNKQNGFLSCILILSLLFLSEIVRAQETIRIASIDQNIDKIMVVTNRAYEIIDENELVFEPRLDADKKNTYLTAQPKNESWVYHKENRLENLFDQKQNYTDWVIFIHGDGKTLQSSVERAREIQKLHKVNVLVYSWPSKDEDMNGIRNFKNSYQNVELSTPQLFSFLKEFSTFQASDKNPFTDQNLSLFLHSLGNYYLERLSVDGYLDQLNAKIFDNVIINAAAVEQEGHNLWVEKIRFADRIYINSNDDDMSLSGLRFLTKLGRQLGESAIEPYAKNAIYINFTKAVGFPGSMGPSHSYYFATVTDKSTNIRNYYTTILHGNEAELLNTELFTYEPEEPAFYIIF